MNIKDMKFGSIDARQEILSRDPSVRKLFLDAFFMPPSFKINLLQSGEKTIVCGPKGSGKTAFLRFLFLNMIKKESRPARFIVFRDEITEQEREQISKIANLTVYIDSDEGDEIPDAINAWQIFIHREIVRVLEENTHLYANTREIIEYKEIVKHFFASVEGNKFKKMLSRIQRGKIRLWVPGAGAEADFIFLDDEGNVNTSELVRYLNDQILKIYFNEQYQDLRVSLFFDEININFVGRRQYRRDAILIRDLIAACGKLNLMFSENSVPIFIYTAVRSEVVDAIESSVREIKKWIDDCAVFIDWYQETHLSNQPIIKLTTKRIIANEINAGMSNDYRSEDDVWEHYFSNRIYTTASRAYVIYNTWGRPRDVVRLLNSAKEHVKPGRKFHTDAFDAAAETYSRGSWEEKKDELNSKYSQVQIESIKKILTSFRRVFTFDQFDAQWEHKSRVDPKINQFCSDRNINVVLDDLFRVGVVGNVAKNQKGGDEYQYLYMGWQNFSIDLRICIHRSLWRELRLTDEISQVRKMYRR